MTAHRPGPTNTRIALIQDHASRVWAATAAITHPGLALADGAERDSQGRGLATLLNACARTELISEVLFMVRSVPDDGAEREQWLARPPARRRRPRLARMVNEQMAATLSQASVRTEAFCTIVVPEDRLAKEAKEFGRGVDARARAMAMLMAEVEGHLRTGMRMSSGGVADLTRSWPSRSGPGSPPATGPASSRRWPPAEAIRPSTRRCRGPKLARPAPTWWCGTTPTTPGTASPPR